MSLINRVLQDLDRRRVGAALPLAPVGVAAARYAPEAPRWLVAAAVAGAGATLALALTFSGAFAGAAARAPGPIAAAPAALMASSAAQAGTDARLPTIAPGPTAAAASGKQADRGGAAAANVIAAVPANLTDADPENLTPGFAPKLIAAAPVDTPASPAPPLAAAETTQSSPAPLANGLARSSRSAAHADAAVFDDRPAAVSAPERVAIATPGAQLDKRSPPASARERAEAAYRGGLAAHRDGRDDRAEEGFALAVHEDVRHSAARQALAVLLVARQRSDDAEALLAEGLALDAHQTLLATTLARIKAARGDVAGAIATLDSQDGAPAQALLATLLQNTGRHSEAIEHYALALQLAPGNGTWWVGLSVSLAALGQHDAAREALLRARGSGSLDSDLLAWTEQRLRAGTRATTTAD